VGVGERECFIAELNNVEMRGACECAYCHPQVASVGYTEAKVKELGCYLEVGRFPFIGNGKAIALGEPKRMTKTIFDAYGRVIHT
jgi:dihydrolipoamide dehydrogenase